MVYRKNYRQSKYQRRGRRRGRGRGGLMNMRVSDVAQKAYAGVKFLKTLINVEKKVWDNDSSTGQTISNAGTVSWLSGITTGTGFNNRTGMSVKAHSLSLKGTLEVNSSSTTPTQVRIILFYNKGLNQGATPAITDILQSAGSSGIAGPITPYQLNNVGDFVVLMDRKYTVDSVQRSQVNVNFFRKLGHHIRWETSGDAIANTEYGHIFMLMISDQSVNLPTLQYYTRLRYIDN